MNTMERARRRFLKEGAALAGLALAAGAVRSALGQGGQYLEKGRIVDPMAVRPPAGGPYVADPRRDALVSPRDTLAYGERSRYVTTMRLSDGSNSGFGGESNAYTPLQDSTGIITPAALHFVSSHGIAPPDMNPEDYRLMINGMVDRPLLFTLDDLMHLPSVSRISSQLVGMCLRYRIGGSRGPRLAGSQILDARAGRVRWPSISMPAMSLRIATSSGSPSTLPAAARRSER